MNENENEHNQNHHRSYWKGIHHSWIFWIFLFLMLVVILYYIKSVDFSLAPNIQLKQP